MHAHLRGQTTYLFFTKLSIELDFSCLTYEKAEPRPDMNIKVAAFTVSEKSINTDGEKLSFLHPVSIYRFVLPQVECTS